MSPPHSPSRAPLRLGVNIDHVATIRNARGEAYPDPARAADMAMQAGADGITAHLREDRRHISDADIDSLAALARKRGRPLNLEMAATPEMEAIALAHRPHAACLVPERREEITTEGGLMSFSHAGAQVQMLQRPLRAVQQMRGECPTRQVEGAQVAMCSGGGAGALFTDVMILGNERP